MKRKLLAVLLFALLPGCGPLPEQLFALKGIGEVHRPKKLPDVGSAPGTFSLEAPTPLEG